MEPQEPKVDTGLDPQLQLEIISYSVMQEVTELPEWRTSKLQLWYGGEWVEYDEYQGEGGNDSRYTAGAYMETIALNPGVITDPSMIPRALYRINQLLEDDEFGQRIVKGLYQDTAMHEEVAAVTLMIAGDAGKAGHWPNNFDWETGEATWIMPPEDLGAAICTLVDPEWLPIIVEGLAKSTL